MRSIQFRWIEAFRALAQTGTTTGAAGLLNIGQSAVSKHIAALEQQLGVTLFDRSHRTLKLTAEGQTLFTEAATALEGFHRFRRVADDLRQLRSGHLHIVAAGNLARGLLPQAIERLRRDAPMSTVSIEIASRKQARTIVEGQQFDLAMLALPYEYPDEGRIEIGRYPGVCIIPRAHPLAKHKTIKIQDLRGVDMVSLPKGTVSRMLVDQMFHQAGAVHAPVVESSGGLQNLVAAGIGVSIVDPFIARGSDPALVISRPLETTLLYEFGILVPINRSQSGLSRRMTQIIVESAMEISGKAAI